jgi:hypothetical protein
MAERDLIILPINQIADFKKEAVELIHGREYQTSLPVWTPVDIGYGENQQNLD